MLESQHYNMKLADKLLMLFTLHLKVRSRHTWSMGIL